ncbi:MAG TPA: vWA domain-containing protein, partial [Anaeromyxobacteraceae bacterium]|nr:vWA domain-containing protein [Anaeromyxobacteraceae bacterium]
MRRLIGSAVLTSLAACGGCDEVPSSAVTDCQAVGIASARTDILFVVDDSGSMGEEQQNLATSFGAFVQELAALPSKSDFQIGVTTTSIDEPVSVTDLQDTFRRPGPNLGAPYPKGALVAVDDLGLYVPEPRILRGDSPTLVQDFQRNVKVGTAGSGKEQGLRAALLAVTDRVADGKNAGFLRPGARLVVIVVSDEDDCSDPLDLAAPQILGDPAQCHQASLKNLAGIVPTPAGDLPATSLYADALNTTPLAGEVRPVLVTTIVGVNQASPPAPACGSTAAFCSASCTPGSGCDTACDRGDRYAQFEAGYGQTGLLDSICLPDFSATLRQIATLIGQEVPLAQEPADWRLLTVSVAKPGGA